MKTAAPRADLFARLRGPLGFEAALVAACGVFVALLAGRGLTFGSKPGRSVYSILHGVDLSALAVGLAGALVFAVALHLGLRLVDRHPWKVVLAWLVAAFVFQVGVRGLYPIPLGHLVESDVCSSFYTPTLYWPPAELLERWTSAAPNLPQHARSNMPGKIFLYYLLELVTRRPAGLGLLLIALSDLSGVLVFLIVREWLGSPRIGLLALAFTLLFPARVAFLPILNTVTPVFLLFSFWLWLVYLRRQTAVWLLVLGASLYLLLFFEPLPFIAGIVFLGALAQRMATSALGPKVLWRIAVLPILGFLVVHAAMVLAFHFDIFAAFRAALQDAADFNRRSNRPYGIWVVENLKDFFLGVGVAPALLFCASLWALGRRGVATARAQGLRTALSQAIADPAANLLAFFTLTLLALDLLGVNRGEVTRLWIFLGVLLELLAAEACLARFRAATALLAIATLALETALVVSMVGFVIC